MNQFETLRQDLHENYGHEYTAAEIDAKLDEVIAKHTKKAELEEFVPLLVEREVREYFGAHRLHVRFAAGTNNALAQAAAELTRRRGPLCGYRRCPPGKRGRRPPRPRYERARYG